MKRSSSPSNASEKKVKLNAENDLLDDNLGHNRSKNFAIVQFSDEEQEDDELEVKIDAHLRI
jgi:hypothetical protein